MPDRRQEECPMAEPHEEIDFSMQVRDGDPSIEGVLPANLANFQERLGVGAQQAASGEARDLSEVEPLDERLKTLVADPIDALPGDERTVRGKVLTGEKIARAIPNIAAFFAEVDLQKKDRIALNFFELNEAGQLVMKDDCAEAYGLGENALQARIRQTRIVYRKDGQICVMTGEEYFTVTEKDENGLPLEMEISDAAKQIAPNSILMERGLPTLYRDGDNYRGERARMNGTGQNIERETGGWTEDASLAPSLARYAYCIAHGFIYSIVLNSYYQSYYQDANIGSRGVLRVNLNLES